MICLEQNAATHALIPCGHLALCGACVEPYASPGSRRECPICRSVVTSALRIYVSAEAPEASSEAARRAEAEKADADREIAELKRLLAESKVETEQVKQSAAASKVESEELRRANAESKAEAEAARAAEQAAEESRAGADARAAVLERQLDEARDTATAAMDSAATAALQLSRAEAAMNWHLSGSQGDTAVQSLMEAQKHLVIELDD